MTERLLKPEEIQSTFQNEVSVKGGGYWDTDKVCKLQDAKTRSATLKEVGEILLRMETLQQFHQARMKLYQGEMPCSPEGRVKP